jgi:hypothetical protein
MLKTGDPKLYQCSSLMVPELETSTLFISALAISDLQPHKPSKLLSIRLAKSSIFPLFASLSQSRRPNLRVSNSSLRF